MRFWESERSELSRVPSISEQIALNLMEVEGGGIHGMELTKLRKLPCKRLKILGVEGVFF